MAILNGEVIIKVTFKNQHIPIGAYTSAVILQECINEIYKHRPLIDKFPKGDKRNNFVIEVIQRKTSLAEK